MSDRFAGTNIVMWTVTANEDENLLLLKSGATLDYACIQKVLSCIYLENEGRHLCYNRFVDLSNLMEINTNLDLIRDLIQRYWKINKVDVDVKIAAYIPFGIMYSIFDFYIRESKGKNKGFILSESIDECAEYLCVDSELLLI